MFPGDIVKRMEIINKSSQSFKFSLNRDNLIRSFVLLMPIYCLVA